MALMSKLDTYLSFLPLLGTTETSFCRGILQTLRTNIGKASQSGHHQFLPHTLKIHYYYYY